MLTAQVGINFFGSLKGKVPRRISNWYADGELRIHYLIYHERLGAVRPGPNPIIVDC